MNQLEKLHELGFRTNLLTNGKGIIIHVPDDLNSNDWTVEIQGEPTRYLISFEKVLKILTALN